MIDDLDDDDVLSGEAEECPECHYKMVGGLPSWNGRAHTCPNETKADRKKRKKCRNDQTCPLCQTCLGLRVNRARDLYIEQVFGPREVKPKEFWDLQVELSCALQTIARLDAAVVHIAHDRSRAVAHLMNIKKQIGKLDKATPTYNTYAEWFEGTFNMKYVPPMNVDPQIETQVSSST